MTEGPAKYRRWLRFSLGTLLMAALLGSLIGYEVHRASERKAMLKDIWDRGGSYQVFPYATHPSLSVPGRARALAFRDPPVFWITLPQSRFSGADIEQIRAGFPGVRIDSYPGEAHR